MLHQPFFALMRHMSCPIGKTSELNTLLTVTLSLASVSKANTVTNVKSLLCSIVKHSTLFPYKHGKLPDVWMRGEESVVCSQAEI